MATIGREEISEHYLTKAESATQIAEVKIAIASVEVAIANLETRLTLRLGGLILTGVGIAVAVLKFWQ